jgi:RimJ/RimL family protein N-acetyltransferase
MASPAVRLTPWGPGDRDLLRRLLGDPAMMTHLGGPEDDAAIDRRQARYERDPQQLRIELAGTGEPAGWVGSWERESRGEQVLEMGWSVLPEMQGRGIARAATEAAIARIRAERPDARLHAYPGVDNAASNALCRSLGFTLLGAYDFEYPPGRLMRCNDWLLDLGAAG